MNDAPNDEDRQDDGEAEDEYQIRDGGDVPADYDRDDYEEEPE